MPQANDNPAEPIDYDAMLVSTAAIKAGIAEALAEHAKLVAFAKSAIEGMWAGGVDGFDIQEWAEKHGLMVTREATETDVRSGIDADVGDTIQVWSGWMKAAVGKVEGA